MSNLFHIPLTPFYKWVHIIGFDIMFCKSKKEKKNRINAIKAIFTTIGKIQNIPNTKNIEITNEFLEYMRINGSSEHHQNNNLKVVIAFGNFIGKDNSFYDINKKEQNLEFLNIKVKSYDEEPD